MHHRIWLLLKTTFTIWSEAKSSRMSAAMTYYTMLSLAPLLMIAIAVATQVYCSDKVKDEIMDYTRDVASPQVAQTVAGLLENTTAPQSGLIAGSISLAVLLYGASGIFSQLFDTFNDIWKVPQQARSGLRFSIRNRLVGVVMVLMVGGLLVSTLALSSVIAYLNQLLNGNYPRLTSWLSLTDRGLSFVLMPFVLSLMFWYFPLRKMKWMDVWPAAGLTAGLLSGSRYLIDLYLSVSTSSEVYGAAGSLVMLLVWVYLTGMILFFGAAFSCAWTKLYGSHSISEQADQVLDHSLLKGLKIKLRPELNVLNGLRDRGLRLPGSSTTQFPLPADANQVAALNPPSLTADPSDSSSIPSPVPGGADAPSSNSRAWPDPVADSETNRPGFEQRFVPRDISNSESYNQPPGEPATEEFWDGRPPPLQPLRRHWSAVVAAEMQQVKRHQGEASTQPETPLRPHRRAA